MRIINKKYLLIILLVGIILAGVVIFKPKEKVQLDNVILKQEVNNKTFAMYKEDTENNYIRVEDTKFPEGYALNVTESNCIDNNGNEIKDALSYENGEVTITSGKTIYCYLYFDKTLGVEIKEKEPSGLSIDQIRGEMYRFQGQQNEGINNYICFGTSDKEKCVEDPDHYMYRIIGIESSTGRIKVIKKEALNDPYQWYTDNDTDITFPDSNIYKAISGSDFLENPNYVPDGWEEKISDNTWTYGDMLSNTTLGALQNGEGLYQIETAQKETRWYNYADKETPDAIQTTVGYEQSPDYGHIVYYTEESGTWTDTFTGKVSLMYLHDYYLSVSDETNCEDGGNNSECKTSWIHLSQNDTNAPVSHEWTMSRNGWSLFYGDFCGLYVDKQGYTWTPPLSATDSVRPVFYINASEELLSGDGTKDNPFIIETSN